MATEKIKIQGAVLELPAKLHCQFSPSGPFLGWIGSAPTFFGHINFFLDSTYVQA